jgi:hypothetical protein
MPSVLNAMKKATHDTHGRKRATSKDDALETRGQRSKSSPYLLSDREEQSAFARRSGRVVRVCSAVTNSNRPLFGSNRGAVRICSAIAKSTLL